MHAAEQRFDGRGRVVGWLEEHGTFFRWDPTRGRIERWCAQPLPAAGCLQAVARGGGRVLLWGRVGPAVVLEEEAGAPVAVLPGSDRSTLTAAALSDDGRRAALGDWAGEVRVFALDGPERASCVAVVSGTAEGGWWSVGSAGFTHVPGEATTRRWGAS